MSHEQPFRIAFIGCGSYCASLARAARRSTSLSPVGCFDPLATQAESFAQDFAIGVFADLDALLDCDDVDGVIIASPNIAHLANTEAAAAAGKHIFVDKPIANTVTDGLAMVEAACRAGVTLAVGHNSRRLPGYRKMKQMIGAGAIGVPLMVEANSSHSGGLQLNPEQWRYHTDQCPALPLMQLGIHHADTIQYLLGDITEVFSFMGHLVIPGENTDNAVCTLRFACGVLGHLGSNYASPLVSYINVYGTGGNLYCDRGQHLKYQQAGSAGKVEVDLPILDTQVEELEEFARCAIGGRPYETDGTAALKALAVVEAALVSVAGKRSVPIAEVLASPADPLP